ncbi:hypothetical protein HOP50_04g32160 [Chloropicon primus]|uniref:Uncharacterized protein n=1 Tax=Chloropicon primus TaxID=1764295 RepID=A0A5B8MKX6_9CHLO|nr:hypothetical protein A3770_04p32120 [Chloropicon primus]UPQ99906.1 hypothetical protein HOP50_04g32160 [Chloropicon primus]|mmetsp:Transcript_6859/g.20050  ORF Transcript_6859/g.20050 Transcript_6859/m.20050 type:complete len:128 (+) Transcript_6859:177-560(+)|eukprot:QDZ20694.1 hypothetical protein A3770_04p32120 [Chloropicon primus]
MNQTNNSVLGQKAHQLEERARQLAFLEDQELKRGSTLNIIPPTPIKKTSQSPAVAAAQQAVISTLRHSTTPQVAPNPVLVPTVPLAASYLHQQLQPQQQQQPATDPPREMAVDGEAEAGEEAETTSS